jgi:16S rRNA processing protein RimM
MADRVIVGRVLTCFGLQGAVKVEPLTFDPKKRFAPGNTVECRSKVYTVEWSRPHGKHIVVKFAEIDSREIAELLRGDYLEIPEDEVIPLPPNSYYAFQLLGAKVSSVKGVKVGVIKDIIYGLANDVWVVKREKDELLVPAVKAAVRHVDIENKLVEIEDWILEPWE